jgi:hypothetical protein
MKSENPITRAIPGFVAVAGLALSLNVSALAFKNTDSRDAIDVHFQSVIRDVTKDIDMDLKPPLKSGGIFTLSQELAKGYVSGTFEFSYATEPKRVKGEKVPESLSAFGGLLISFGSLLVLKTRARTRNC